MPRDRRTALPLLTRPGGLRRLHQQSVGLLAVSGCAALPIGDYGAFVDDELVAVVERKSLADLAGSLTSGRLAYRLAALTETPRAAIVVEDRYSAVFKLEHVRPALVAHQLGECQVRWPTVPIIFAETRPLAQEWTYRFLAAAVQEGLTGREALRVLPHRTNPDD